MKPRLYSVLLLSLILVFTTLVPATSYAENDPVKDMEDSQSLLGAFGALDTFANIESLSEEDTTSPPAITTPSAITPPAVEEPEDTTEDETPLVPAEEPPAPPAPPLTYSVSFNANGGKSLSFKSLKVTEGQKYGKLPSVKRTGYWFKGWKTGNNKQIWSGSIVDKNDGRTLYANWVKYKKATFNPNNGTLSYSKRKKDVAYGKTYGTLPKPKRKDYVFVGWFTKKKGGTQITANMVNNYKDNKTYYAQWKRPQYVVTYNANGGSVSVASKKVSYKGKYGTLATPKRANYKFVGWYTKKVGGKKVTALTQISTKGKRTLYAHWKYNFNITEILAYKNTAPRPGKKLGKFIGVTIHNTAMSAPGNDSRYIANRLRNEWKTREASWHYGVDDKYITRAIPEKEVAWHAANSKGNNGTIAIEICENSDGDLLAATDKAAALAAKILKDRGIKKAVANKNIFMHNYWYSGTECAHLLRAGKPYSWNTFVSKVNAHLKADDI